MASFIRHLRFLVFPASILHPRRRICNAALTAGLGDDTLSWVMNLEKLWEDYPLPEGSEADFALRVEGDELEPYVRPGGIALIKRGAEIRDGDVGLFFAGGDIVLRQYCEDWAGNVYLFAVNRRRSGLDIRLPAAGGAPVCSFGRVLLEDEVPLPEI